jgi:hypothetical protein
MRTKKVASLSFRRYQNTFKLRNHTGTESKSRDLLGRDQERAGFAGKGLVKAPAPPDLLISSPEYSPSQGC